MRGGLDWDVPFRILSTATLLMGSSLMMLMVRSQF